MCDLMTQIMVTQIIIENKAEDLRVPHEFSTDSSQTFPLPSPHCRPCALMGDAGSDFAESRENVDFRMHFGVGRFSDIRGSSLNCLPISSSSLYIDQSAESKY